MILMIDMKKKQHLLQLIDVEGGTGPWASTGVLKSSDPGRRRWPDGPPRLPGRSPTSLSLNPEPDSKAGAAAASLIDPQARSGKLEFRPPSGPSSESDVFYFKFRRKPAAGELLSARTA